jgi:hypothetical protein
MGDVRLVTEEPGSSVPSDGGPTRTGCRAIVLDDVSTGRSSNLDAALRHPACELVVGSVLDAPVVDHVVVGSPDHRPLVVCAG